MTATETAIRAIVAALTTKAALPGSKIIAPERNQDIVSRLVSVGSGLSVFLNVLDGDRENPDELLGADLGNTTGYEHTLTVHIEWAVAGGTSDDRETRFDDGRQEIWDALKPVVSGGSVTYLGGAADGVELRDLLPHQQTTVAGLPNIKACEFVFAVSFTSADPF